MDGFNEKKWFVYVVDHHEGPFSLAEIQVKMHQGQLTTANYVWAEGMADWKPMTEVSAFGSILKPQGAPPISVPTQKLPDAEPSLVMESPSRTSLASHVVMPELEVAPAVEAHQPAAVESSSSGITPVLEIPTEAVDSPYSAQPAPTPVDRVGLQPQEDSTMSMEKSPRSGKASALKWLFPIVFIIAIAVAAMQGYLDPVLQNPAVKSNLDAVSNAIRPTLERVGEKVPALGKFLSPIPKVDDVSPEAYKSLQEAAKGKAEEKPKVSIVQSQTDSSAPVFYVSSNLPEGATFKVTVQGKPDTLLNRLEFTQTLRVSMSKRLGKTEPLKDDGKPIPRGEYLVTVEPGEQQPPEVRSILTAKGNQVGTQTTMFLGGAKDATYEARLKEFHAKLKEKATAEIAEVRQYSLFLDNQLSSTLDQFAKLVKKGKVTKAQRKTWEDFHNRFANIEAQLNQSFTHWTPDVLQTEYFYGQLYLLTQQAAQAVSKVHGLQNAFFTGAIDPKSFDLQQGEAAASAQSALSALKSKIDQVEKLGDTPNGMPRRDGL